ncbi:MAG: ribose 5-phosphate isomerase B [Opitutaceae bacterium]|nr:ribose 5-phosphate isomerase B [Opitutaceae bacterium]
MSTLAVAIASDHAGLDLKQLLAQELKSLGHEVADLGTHSHDSVDYPDYAAALAEWMKKNPGGRGVLICGSGVGISIAANRHRHLRAALATNGLTAALARRHNDANVLCLGARLVGSDIARDCLAQFLATGFEGGRHAKRVEKMS